MKTAADEILYDCPHCGRRNFGRRGLHGHRCTAFNRQPLTLAQVQAITGPIQVSVLKSQPSSPSMPKPSAKPSALTLVSHPQLVAQDDALDKLQRGVIAEFAHAEELERELAARRILTGIALLRIKASLKHGKWLPWFKGNLGGKKYRMANYAMRLAMTFLDQARVDLPDLLALPGGQLSLAEIDPAGPAKNLLTRLHKFIGVESFYALLDKHDIKPTAALGGERTKALAHGNDADEEPDAEELRAMKRDEAAAWLEQGRQLFVTENILQHLQTAEVRGWWEGVEALGRELEAAVTPLLKTAPTAQPKTSHPKTKGPKA